MIELNIPGRGRLKLDHLVCDVNGTLALDGQLLDGIATSLAKLRNRLEIHLVTADTHGRQDEIDRELDLPSTRLKPGDKAAQKAEYVRNLGWEGVAAIGQGANDEGMLRAAALGICILSREGTASATLLAADLLMPDILSALELFDQPLRIVATLRK